MRSRPHLAIMVGAVAVGLLVSLAGKHALERHIAEGTAILVSHGVGLLVMAFVLWRWGFRKRAAPAAPDV